MSHCKTKGWLSLGLAVSIVLVVWTLVLPWIGSRPSIRSRIDDLNRQGIDPAALYYTDLEAMHRLESDLAAIRRANSGAFWRIASRTTE